MKHVARLLGILYVALLLSGCFGPKTPQEVTASFWQAVAEDDAADVVKYSTLTGPEAYDRFDKDWHGYEPQWGRVVIDGDEASVEAKFTNPSADGDRPREFETHLVRRDGRWLVDYARTAQAVRGDFVTQLLGTLDRLQADFSRQLEGSAQEFQAEMQRLSEEAAAYSHELGERADETFAKYGAKLQAELRALEESVRDALSDKKKELSDHDRRVLKAVADDLESSSEALDEPSYDSIVESGRTVSRSGVSLASTSKAATADYRDRWRELARRFEAEFQKMLDDLANVARGNVA